MRGESSGEGWCETKREWRGREGNEQQKKSEVKSIRNVRPPTISHLLLHGVWGRSSGGGGVELKERGEGGK